MSNQVISKAGELLNKIPLRHCDVGDVVKRKPDAKAVYVINHRNRATKNRKAEYSLSDWDDCNREIFLKEDTLVYVGFDF